MPDNSGIRSGGIAGWRYAVLIIAVFGTLAIVLTLPPIAQDPAFHQFADTRAFAGIPNFSDVVSNIFFLIIGVVGIRFCLRNGAGAATPGWLTLFFGVALVSAGSVWYHCNPDNDRLVWDRLPITVGFMGLFTALLGEYLHPRLAAYLLIPAIALGAGSVLYWYRSDDLRLYAWVQFMPLLTVPLVLLLFRSRYNYQWLLGIALVLYILAKVAEIYDAAVFHFTQETLSGHTLKHLLAAAACYSILVMLQKRWLRT